MPAASYFLKFAPAPPAYNIVGSSQDARHPHWVKLRSFSLSTVQQPTGSWSQGRGQLPPEVVCLSDDVAAVARIYQACSTAWQYDSATLEGVEADGRVFLRLLMTAVGVSWCRHVNPIDRDDRLPLTQFGLESGKMDSKYFGVGATTTSVFGG